MELADVKDSKSFGLITRAGSTPAAGTKKSRSSERDFFIQAAGLIYVNSAEFRIQIFTYSGVWVIIKKTQEEKYMEMRRKDREIKDVNQIYDILQRCDTINLGMNGVVSPYVIPMTFAYAMQEGKIVIYFHSAPDGRKWEILNHDPNVCVEAHLYYKTVRTEDGGITAKYESVIGTGKAELVEKREEKVAALKLMLEHYKHSGFPAESCKGLPMCTVFKVVLTEVSGKHNL